MSSRQTRLEKMKEFNANVRSLNQKKGKARSAALAPPEAPLPKLEAGKQAPPTYLTQDQERGVKDTGSKQTGAEEEEQEKAVDRAQKIEVGKTDFAEGKRTTTTVTSTNKAKVKGNYATYLGHLTNRNIQRVYYGKRSTWVPNSYMLERILFATHRTLRPSDYLYKHHRYYLSIMTTLYYSVLFYVQILRVQTEIKKVKKEEGTWLRAFFRHYPEEKLVIAGPLEPVFNGICAYKADDDKFGIVYPELPTFDNYWTTDNGFDVKLLTVPNVPFLYNVITTYASDGFRGRNDDYSKGQPIVPIANILGNDLWAGAGKNGGWIFASSMMNQVHPDAKTMYEEANQHWKGSELNGLSVKYTRTPANDAQAATRLSFDSIGQFLQLQSDYSWFEEALNCAVIHSRFFEGVTNLSYVNTIGGLDLPIRWLISSNKTGDDRTAETTRPTGYYPKKFKSVHVKATSYEEDIDTNDIQVSSIHMMNANFGLHEDKDELDDWSNAPHKVYWNKKAIEYKDGSWQDVIIGGISDIQADFYVPEGI